MFKQCALITLFSLSFSPAALSFETKNTVTEDFINSTVEKHNLPKEYVENALAKAKKDQAVLDAIARPWEAKPWFQYYPIFLTEKRIDKGVQFWKDHEDTLSKAEKEFGVPAEIIISILAVESFFGTYKGKYPVLDSLYTLGFHYPKRSKFFKKELGEYLKLSFDQSFVVDEVKGSYAGAMGWSQFISSSYRHYAVDFDGDKKVDLINNVDDAIGSVANYFKMHKWQAGRDIAVRASVENTPSAKLLGKGLKPAHTIADLEKHNIISAKPFDASEKVKLLQLELETGHDYWLGLHNFYVITRYNHSPLYAMAVYQLSEQIKDKYNG